MRKKLKRKCFVENVIPNAALRSRGICFFDRPLDFARAAGRLTADGEQFDPELTAEGLVEPRERREF
jgi:hypothetical protein